MTLFRDLLKGDFNMQIVEKLKQLVASERKITAEIIEHIQEIDRKKIHVQMGFPTLFSFLTEYIGYSAASAQRRIEAARLLTAVPEVKKDIQSGSLNLSQVALVAQSIRQKQKEMPEVQIKAQDKKELLDSIKNQNFENSQKIISQTLDLEIKAFDRKTVQKDESVRFEVTFTKDQMDAFNKVKSLISHINPSASVAEVFDYLAKDYLKRKDPMRSGIKIGGKHKTISEAEMKNETLVKPARKRISISVKRVVWTRDQGKCQHFNPTTGKKCGSPYLLEIDHIKRVRNGGDNDPNNLRILCHSHNHLRG
jgi:hypothetical protein